MKLKTDNSGLRRHRSRKKFRFEYIRGKYSNWKPIDSFNRWLSKREDDEEKTDLIRELLRDYWKSKE